MTRRREFLAAALAAAAPAQRKPNLIFLLADDQRWDTLGCMGNPIIQTPNVDRLARGGVIFDNNFVSTAICMTSRACFFTGLLEPSHGISDFSKPFTPEQMAATYPALLRQAGYRTGFIGKYGVGAKLPVGAFDYFEAFPGQGKYFPGGGKEHLTGIQGDQALEFLNGCSKDQPFSLSVSFKAPHVQDEDPRQFLYDPADEALYRDVTMPVPETASERHFRMLPEFLQDSEGRKRWGLQFATPEMYQRSVKGYYRLITEVDRQVGRLVTALEKRGDLDRTIIVYTGDNGYFLGEHGLSHKWYLYEESIRTPLVIWDPRLPKKLRGQRRKEMALNIDIAPTLLRAAGLEPPPGMQGRDLAPLLRGRSAGWRREWFYSHLFQHPKIPRSEGIRDTRFSYIRWIGQNPLYEELFDHTADPHNVSNLAGKAEHETTLNRLRGRWQAWRDRLAGWRPDRRWSDPAM
ncbi:MAG: sulfatase [Acidobacteria bacterium]|nr:sulfatase [Acidobacteriota bacterium]